MAVQKSKSNSQSEQTKEGITRITVGGFKSISPEQSIEIRPLTILAGANRELERERLLGIAEKMIRFKFLA